MKKKVLFVLSALFGLMMVNSGLNKFLGYMPQPELTEAAGSLMYAFAQAGWLFPLIGIIEIVAGALFVTNRYRTLGAIMILPITVGIFLFHLVLDPGTLMISVSLLTINIWAIYENRERLMPMIAQA